MSVPLDINAIEARANAATPGPWEWEVDDESLISLGRWRDATGVHVLSCERCKSCRKRDDERCLWPAPENADFIAHARTDVPALVAEVRRLQAENERLRDALYRDQTGLAIGLGAVVREIKSRAWIIDGRGPYEWDDDRYRDEAGLAMRAAVEIAEKALRDSGALALAAIAEKTAPATAPEPQPKPAPRPCDACGTFDGRIERVEGDHLGATVWYERCQRCAEGAS